MNIGKETEQIEFKTSLSEQKEGFESISSILNKHGNGKLYFGVRDNGDVCGVQIRKDTLNHLARDIEIHVKPFLTFSINVLRSDTSLEFIEISFGGNNPPYCAYNRYFLRFADRDKIMDQEMLANYFERKKISYINWENSSSDCPIDDIDDDNLESYIERGNRCGRIKFKYDDKRKVLNRLGLLFDEKTLNNAGNVLFSDKKPILVKFATFASDKRITILDMENFSGNIYECIDASMKYISKHIDWNIKFDGGSRSKEVAEIPLEAIREIVVSAFAHGSYESVSTEFEISVFNNRVVIYSPGHFPRPFKPEQFAYDGQEAIPLNNKICSILYNDETIEKHSTGFERTFEFCKNENIYYEYSDTGLGFRFTFYRKNVHGHVQEKIDERDIKIVEILKGKPSITINELSIELAVSSKTASRALDKLKTLNKVKRVGSDKGGYWEIID